jgi:hypothetical protein
MRQSALAMTASANAQASRETFMPRREGPAGLPCVDAGGGSGLGGHGRFTPQRRLDPVPGRPGPLASRFLPTTPRNAAVAFSWGGLNTPTADSHRLQQEQAQHTNRWDRLLACALTNATALKAADKRR